MAVVQGIETGALLAELPPPLRLAVAYAPTRTRAAWIALLLLDRRLARAALGASEPILGQLRLAWWRDRFGTAAAQWPEGEPLLAALAAFDGERAALGALVDGWEGLVGGEGDAAALARLVAARVGVVVALARMLGCPSSCDAVAAMARQWALADLAVMLDRPEARDLAAAAQTPTVRLPREMRPLVILAGMSHMSHAQPNGGHGVRALLRIVRLGLLGR